MMLLDTSKYRLISSLTLLGALCRISQSVNQSISQSVNQSISQSVNQSISQSVNQSIDKTVSKYILETPACDCALKMRRNLRAFYILNQNSKHKNNFFQRQIKKSISKNQKNA